MNNEISTLLDEKELNSRCFSRDESDKEVGRLLLNMEKVDRFLRSDQLYSGRGNFSLKKLLLVSLCLTSTAAFAGDPVTIVNNFVSVMITRILPTMNLGYFGHALHLFSKDDPNAKKNIVNVVISSACLLGINGVWRFIQSQAN